MFPALRRLLNHLRKWLLEDRLQSPNPSVRRWYQFFFSAVLVSVPLAFGLAWLLPADSYTLLGRSVTSQQLIWVLRGLLLGSLAASYTVRTLLAASIEDVTRSSKSKPLALMQSLVNGGPAGKLFAFVGYAVFILGLQFGCSFGEALLPTVLMDLYLVGWALAAHLSSPEPLPDDAQLIGHAVGVLVKHKAFLPLVGAFVSTLTVAGVIYKGHTNVVVSTNTLETAKTNLESTKVNLEIAKVNREASHMNWETERMKQKPVDAPQEPAAPPKPKRPPRQMDGGGRLGFFWPLPLGRGHPWVSSAVVRSVRSV